MKKAVPLTLMAATLFGIALAALAATSPSLECGTASGLSGTVVTLPVTFTEGSTEVAGLQYSIGLPSGWSIVSVSAGPATNAASKAVDVNTSNGMFMIFGANQNTIATGVVANVQIKIASAAVSGSYPITISGVILSALNGAPVPSAAPINGSVIVSSTIPTISSFIATPASITVGSSSTLSWSVTGATSLSISPNVGTVTGTSISVKPTATTTYTLIATDSSGSATATTTVTVSAKGAPKITSFTANPASIVTGASSTLSW
ncbi:MAG: cohesin domain-containing protein, partial [Bryobacteraceae bacterium]